ncbi:MAG: type II toxin-antitoxin system PemK/MazF family toxin [Gammaproteobacteria bacterium]|nr:type II toxin-antitoxin system PemK/MazF family toxin [Gammaproteobacteria bacterium]
METYKPFSVVVVPFPFTDASQAKRRPAVVLSTEDFQKQTKHITLLMVTSAKHSQWHGDHKIIDLESAGLHAESIVRQKIFTLDQRIIIDSIGKLALKDKEAVIKYTHRHLKF